MTQDRGRSGSFRVDWRTTLRAVLVVLVILVVLVALWWQFAVQPSLWEMLTDGANY